MIHSILQRALLNAAETLVLEASADMSCCGSDNYGMGCNCGGDYPTLLSGLQGVFGLGALGDLGPMWSGDPFEFGVRLADWNVYWDGYLQFGNPMTNQNQYLQAKIADPMNESGWYYNVRAYIYDHGVTSPFIVVAGNTNDYFDSDDSVKNDITSYVQNVIGGVSSIDYLSIAWKPTVHPNQQEQPKQIFQPSPREQRDRTTAPPVNLDTLTLQQRQAACEQAGMVYSETKQRCVCGTIDQWMVDAGLKKTCGESVLGFKSGAALAIVGVGAILLLPKILKNF